MTKEEKMYKINTICDAAVDLQTQANQAKGSVTKKVEPRSIADSAHTRPPCL
jgi:hypothetical protein